MLCWREGSRAAVAAPADRRGERIAKPGQFYPRHSEMNPECGICRSELVIVGPATKTKCPRAYLSGVTIWIIARVNCRHCFRYLTEARC